MLLSIFCARKEKRSVHHSSALYLGKLGQHMKKSRSGRTEKP